MSRKIRRSSARSAALSRGRWQEYAWGFLEMGVAFLLTLAVVMGPRVYAWIRGDAETKARVDHFYQSLTMPGESGDPTSLRLPASDSE